MPTHSLTHSLTHSHLQTQSQLKLESLGKAWSQANPSCHIQAELQERANLSPVLVNSSQVFYKTDSAKGHAVAVLWMNNETDNPKVTAE